VRENLPVQEYGSLYSPFLSLSLSLSFSLTNLHSLFLVMVVVALVTVPNTCKVSPFLRPCKLSVPHVENKGSARDDSVMENRFVPNKLVILSLSLSLSISLALSLARWLVYLPNDIHATLNQSSQAGRALCGGGGGGGGKRWGTY
jgi:hypothetical protein